MISKALFLKKFIDNENILKKKKGNGFSNGVLFESKRSYLFYSRCLLSIYDSAWHIVGTQ